MVSRMRALLSRAPAWARESRAAALRVKCSQWSRMSPILLLMGGASISACEDTGGPSAEGTLVVSTSTGGADPDPDGYLLTVDGLDSLALDPNETVEVELRAGEHALQLLGVADHCSVTPGASLGVTVPPRGSTPVAFEIGCPAVAARIMTTTTGLDIDPNGYRVLGDDRDQGRVPSNGTMLLRLDPGSRTIGLSELTPNCTIDGPASRTVTIVVPEVLPIEFAVVCTATSGVIGVLVEASGPGVRGVFGARVDEAEVFLVDPGRPSYLTGVPAGEHVISLIGPVNCSVETDPQPVTVTGGELVRDTVEVAFSVTCGPPEEISGPVRITVPVTGAMPDSTAFSVRYEHFGYWDYGGTSTYLGAVEPNGALIAELPVSSSGSGADPYWYRFYLDDVPANCTVRDPHPYPAPGFTITRGDTLAVEFAIACSP